MNSCWWLLFLSTSDPETRWALGQKFSIRRLLAAPFRASGRQKQTSWRSGNSWEIFIQITKKEQRNEKDAFSVGTIDRFCKYGARSGYARRGAFRRLQLLPSRRPRWT